MKSKTIVGFAKVLPDDATITQVEFTAAVEAARAIYCLAQNICYCFDLDGNLIEDWSGIKTRTRNRMKEDHEGRWKRKVNYEEEEIERLSNSSSSSVHVGLLDSCSAEEMTSQKLFKLGAKPQWSAHADWPNMSDESSATPIPPWRDKSRLRLTTKDGGRTDV